MSAVKSDEVVKNMKIMIVGDSNVGKTVFVLKYVTGEFRSQFVSTVGIDFMTKEIEFCENAEDEEKPMRKIRLQLWDTAGQERFQSITTAYFRSSKNFLLMFDVTSEQSFAKLDHWVDVIKSSAEVADPKIILCGNKVDLTDQRQVDEEVARKKAEELGMEYFETSAKTGDNINEAINCLVNMTMAGKSPEEESDDDVADEEVVKKEIEEKVKLGEDEVKSETEGKKPSKCRC